MAGDIVDELMGAPEEPEDDKYNIHAQILKRFGKDISPEARAKVAEAAASKKKWLALPALVSGIGQAYAGSANPNLKAVTDKAAQIDDETTGQFDRDREQVVKDYVLGQKSAQDQTKFEQDNTKFGQQQTVFEQGQAERAEGRDPAAPMADDAREMISWVGNKLGIPPTKLEGLGVEQLSKHPLYDKAVELWAKEKMANRPVGMGGFGPGDAPFLEHLIGINTGQKPLEIPPTDGVSPKALAAGVTATGAARGRANTDSRFRTLRGKELEDFQGLTVALGNLDKIGANLPGWDTGFVKNKANRLAWYAGMDSPQRAKINTQLGINLAEYIKSVSGTAASDNERAYLEAIAPNASDDEDTLFAKMEGFQDFLEGKLETTIKADKSVGGYNMDGAMQMAQDRGWLKPAGAFAPPQTAAPTDRSVSDPGRTVVKKQFSKSQNKTKLIYSDGTEEIVDGQQ